MRLPTKPYLLFLPTVLCGLFGLQAQVNVDSGLPAYTRAAAVTGSLFSIGSDTMDSLMEAWLESFGRNYGLSTKVLGLGSSAAVPALIESNAQLGPMSREMKAEEIDRFEKRFGYKPTKITVAMDAINVIVSKANTIKAISLQELSDIYFKNGQNNITSWEQLGVKGLKGRPISVFGRSSDSGTASFFREKVLSNGDYKGNIKEMNLTATVVRNITFDRFAIGYCGTADLVPEVKMVPVAEKDGGQAFDANYENVMSGKYPLSRNLYIYINKHPQNGLPQSVSEFIKFALSKDGQEIAIKKGYLPLSADMSNNEKAKL
jgi:phosphate transport system substrate-binding protein